jgi:hypothetical protein
MMRVEFVGNTPPTKTVLATKHGDIFKIDGQYYIRGFDAVILLRPALGECALAQPRLVPDIRKTFTNNEGLKTTQVTVIGCLNLRGD